MERCFHVSTSVYAAADCQSARGTGSSQREDSWPLPTRLLLGFYSTSTRFLLGSYSGPTSENPRKPGEFARFRQKEVFCRNNGDGKRFPEHELPLMNTNPMNELSKQENAGRSGAQASQTAIPEWVLIASCSRSTRILTKSYSCPDRVLSRGRHGFAAENGQKQPGSSIHKTKRKSSIQIRTSPPIASCNINGPAPQENCKVGNGSS